MILLAIYLNIVYDFVIEIMDRITSYRIAFAVRIMQRSTIISTLTILSMVLAVSFSSSCQIHVLLTREQAVRKAEQFIVDNGYTDAPANRSRLAYELLDQYERDLDSILIPKRNTLQRKAFCISEDSASWHVGFLSRDVDIRSLDSALKLTDLSGRAVIVKKDGSDVRMAHKEPRFSVFEKL
ncbi:MAG: hypothetical protein JSS89_01475 [Bacteroidetes bacterium]|nr:hypothetical protein [Bacteroidota bacterium]